MCIRDSKKGRYLELFSNEGRKGGRIRVEDNISGNWQIYTCLLYTSDAADERSSVDLGGRRIIKKKNIDNNQCGPELKHTHYTGRNKHK